MLHFEEAKQYGEILIVSVTKDENLNKGLGRPVFPQDERVAMVRALRVVDWAFPCSSAIEALEYIKPAWYVKGEEYEDNLPEEQWCEERGIRVAFTHSKRYSSTELLNFYARQG